MSDLWCYICDATLDKPSVLVLRKVTSSRVQEIELTIEDVYKVRNELTDFVRGYDINRLLWAHNKEDK